MYMISVSKVHFLKMAFDTYIMYMPENKFSDHRLCQKTSFLIIEYARKQVF